MEYYEDDFIADYSKVKEYQGLILRGNRPSNSLDYMKFNSEEYLKYKFEQKVRDQIKGLNLDEKSTKEICEGGYYYYKKIKSIRGVSLKISDIISIVAFKVIKKYSLPFSNNEVYEKIGLDKGKYLKYSNLFNLDSGIKLENNQNGIKIEIEYNRDKFKDNEEIEQQKFYMKILQYLNHIINTLTALYKYKPNIIKLKPSKIDVCKYIDNISSMLNIKDENNKLDLSSSNLSTSIPVNVFSDNISLLSEIKNEAKNLIYFSASKDVNFFTFFYNKILIESLAAGIVKYFLEDKGLKLNLQVFKDNFNISSSGISKGMKMIGEYIKLINNK